MKKIVNLLFCILYLPITILLSPIIWYRFIRGYTERLSIFLTFGRPVIGGFSGKLKVGTKLSNVIYQSDNFDIWGNPFNYTDNEKRKLKHLLKMRVYNFWLEDDYLFVKVYHNDKLIEKFNRDNIVGFPEEKEEKDNANL